MNVFCISDNHFFHENIIKYCNRPFQNRHCMNYFMIHKWNSVVNENDIVIHAGDFCLGREYELNEATKQLNGNIILIRGNHDRFTTSQYKKAGIKEIFKDDIIVNDICFRHKPIEGVDNFKFVIHGHIHNNSHECLKPNHYNLSVEIIDYKPVKLSDLNIELVECEEQLKKMFK